MTAIYLLLLLICVTAVLHTYVIYPWLMLGWAGSRDAKELGEGVESPPKPTVFPPVAVLMAAHNEEAVLEEKLATLAAQDYAGELTFYVGSDCSTDRTNAILEAWAARNGRFRPTLFDSRRGKPAIINQLAAQAGKEGIYLMTDASVMLRPDVVTQLVRPMLEDPTIGVVDSTMLQTGGRAEGIGYAEETYISREVDVKRAEGRRWGAMIGPFGGCWALRAEAFTPVPDNFLVDDFFLCMSAYERGFRGVSSEEAIVEEGVGQSLKDEFRRKVRISGGNWQNLFRFRKLWWPFWKNPLAYAFFSHKVLRWWTPFFLLIGLLSWMALLLSLGYENNYWPGLLLASLINAAIMLPVLDFVLTFYDIHFRPARFTTYFLAMNAALLVGFYRYLTGIRTNVWQPSQRH